MATVTKVRVLDASGNALATLPLGAPTAVDVTHVQLLDRTGAGLVILPVEAGAPAAPAAPPAVAQVQLLDAGGNGHGTVALASPPPAGAAIMQLLDAGGNVISTATIPTSDGKLPTNLDWYRDASKWLVTTSGAAIVFGYGLVAAAGVSMTERIAFLVSGGFLLASVLAGILCHFWILTLANAHEKLSTGLTLVEATRFDARRTKAKRLIGRTYLFMMWPFFLGMAVFVAFCTYRVFWPATAKEVPTPPTVLAGSGDDVVAVLYDPQQKRVLLLQRTGTGYRWISAPEHHPAPPKSPAPAAPPKAPVSSATR